MKQPIRALASSLAFCVAAGTVAAEPAARMQLDPRLGALLGQEQAALGSVAPGHVERILGATAEQAPPRRAHAAASEALTCLARAVYHEARGEGDTGMRAVAEVVLNRVEDDGFPGSICRVVYQGVDNPAGCQFSFACDGSEAARLEPAAWARAQGIAREMAAGAPRRLTDGATHFHTVAVRPNWSRVYSMTAEIGAHRFYRRPVQVASN